MVFSVKTITEASKNSFPINNPIEEDYSLFDMGLQLVLDENINFESVLLNDIILSEGIVGDIIIKYAANKAKQIDMSNVFSKIFDWFIEAIGKLANSFSAFLLNFVNKDAQLKAFKKQLAGYTGSVHCNRDMYVYTNLDIDTSYTSYQNEIDKEYNSLVERLEELKTCKDYNTLTSLLNKLKDDVDNNGEYMDLLRGRVIGIGSGISADDFGTEVFNYFRGGVSKGGKLFEKNIDNSRFRDAYDNYYNSSKQISKVKRDSSKLKAESLKEKAKIRLLNPKDYISEEMKLNMELIGVYNNIVVGKCRRVNEICNIYTILFSAKIDAIRSYNHDNRDILLAACKEIAKGELS